MLITITQFVDLARDKGGTLELLPIGGKFNGNEELTAVGNATALETNTKFVRVATDTAVKVNAYGAGSSLLLPAGAIEFFPVTGGQVLAFSAA